MKTVKCLFGKKKKGPVKIQDLSFGTHLKSKL